MKQKKIDLGELPKHSPWPARLLGLEPWGQKVKSKQEIDREYEVETWGAYLDRIRSEGLEKEATEKLLDEWQCGRDTAVVFSRKDDLLLGTFGEAYGEYLEAVRARVSRHLPAPAVMELGCGYGSIILHLAKCREYVGTRMMAAEYTASGRELTGICATGQGLSLDIGCCDFTSRDLTDLIPPEGSVVFTCVSACTLPDLPRTFVRSLLSLRPAVVIHLEPLYEHQDGPDLLAMMRRRYAEVNDYNRNLLTLLKTAEGSGEITILGEERALIGVNPFFPVSAVSWRPRRQEMKRGE